MENQQYNSKEEQEKSENDEKASRNILHEEVIEALLKEAEKRGMIDCKLDISPGSAKGDNFMGVVAKVKLTGKNFEGKEIEWDWIAKAAPQTDLYRSVMKIDVAYSREVYMYHLFEKFHKFQEEKKLLRPFNAHPTFILSYLEPYKESFVMEDLKSVGYILRDKKKPLDKNHVKLVMKEYGRLHAISFALRDQNPEEFEKLSKETEEKMFIPKNQEEFDEMVKYQDNFNSKLITAMREETDAETIDMLKLYSKDAMNHILRVLQTTSQYSVIGHGDCWVNNMLWKYEDNNPEVPTQVCLLDWQLARYGSPAFDLSYFFYACTDQQFREKYYDQMIKLYYYTLCENLAEMGSNPQKLFPYSAFQDELKRGCIYGFYMACMVIQLIVSEPDELPAFETSDTIEEFTNSLDYKTVNEEVFKERVRGVALHMHQSGYFDFLIEKRQ